MADNGNLRDRALQRLKAKQGFWYALATWAVLSVVLLIIWALSGTGYFWPAWPIAGMAIWVLFSGLNAFGPGRGGPSESRIQDEMKRLS